MRTDYQGIHYQSLYTTARFVDIWPSRVRLRYDCKSKWAQTANKFRIT